MASEVRNSATSRTDDRYARRREKRIQNVKTGGDLMMYVGSAALMLPCIKKARENQNSIMGLCATGAGAILSVGLGSAASKLFNKTVDKIADFWEDVKPSGPAEKKQEAQKDG